MKNEVLTEEESKNKYRDFPGRPGTKNLPSNSGKGGSIPSQGTKIPHAMGQLSLRSTKYWAQSALQPTHHNWIEAPVLQLKPNTGKINK